MQSILEGRIAQVKTLHDMCIERGLQPFFNIEEFESTISEMRAQEKSEQDVSRYVLFCHKLVHELLYAPPGRGI